MLKYAYWKTHFAVRFRYEQQNGIRCADHPDRSCVFRFQLYLRGVESVELEWIDGLLGSFLGTHMLIPFIIGLIICFREAYLKH